MEYVITTHSPKVRSGSVEKNREREGRGAGGRKKGREGRQVSLLSRDLYVY